MAKARDYSIIPPVKLTELNKESMLKFCKAKGSEELKWFIALCNENRKEKTNNLDNSKVNGFDDTVIKKEFAKKYFPDLVNKKKKKKPTTFEKMLQEAEKQLNNN